MLGSLGFLSHGFHSNDSLHRAAGSYTSHVVLSSLCNWGSLDVCLWYRPPCDRRRPSMEYTSNWALESDTLEHYTVRHHPTLLQSSYLILAVTILIHIAFRSRPPSAILSIAFLATHLSCGSIQFWCPKPCSHSPSISSQVAVMTHMVRFWLASRPAAMARPLGYHWYASWPWDSLDHDTLAR